MNNTSDTPLNRRTFLTRSAAALAATSVVGFPAIVRASNEKILKLGIVGCGGRGTGALDNALSADKNVVLTAMGDVVRERIYTSHENISKTKPDQVKVEEGNKFVGLDAIDQVLATDIDVVILTTPPGFRPEHLKKAVAAGKHTFCEKPVAVDAPGVRDVIATAAEAKKKGPRHPVGLLLAVELRGARDVRANPRRRDRRRALRITAPISPIRRG